MRQHTPTVSGGYGSFLTGESLRDTGKVYYVYKDFPLVSLHPQAGLAAEAAECAGHQGRY